MTPVSNWDLPPTSGESDYGTGYHYIEPCVGMCIAARMTRLMVGGLQAYREKRQADQYAKYHVDESDGRALTFDVSKASENWSARGIPVEDWPKDLPVEIVHHGLFGRRKK